MIPLEKKLLLLLPLFLLSGCRGGADMQGSSYDKCAELLASSRVALQSQNYDDAMDLSVKALALAEENGYKDLTVESLYSIAHLDVVTSQDNHAWEFCIRAEEIARKEGLDGMLVRILNLKGKICTLAEISPEFNRNDEAIGYLDESLRLCRDADFPEERVDALLYLSQAYVNKNRWNTVLDRSYYRAAGESLDEAERIVREYGLEQMNNRITPFKMRYFRQGGRIDEAIGYCQRILSESPEDDFLIKMQTCDFLTTFYAQRNDVAEALDYHNLCTQAMSSYYRKVADEKLLEIQTRYETSLKESKIMRLKYQLLSLVLLIGLCTLSICWLYGRNLRIRRRNIELQKANHIKEDLLSFISKDLKNPLSSQKNAISELSRQCVALSEDDVKQRCSDLVSSTEALTEEVAQYMTDVIMARQSAASNFGLTKREVEILQMSAKGLTVKEIASNLHISDRTVGNHRTHIFEKLDVGNISEMIQKATEYGIL